MTYVIWLFCHVVTSNYFSLDTSLVCWVFLYFWWDLEYVSMQLNLEGYAFRDVGPQIEIMHLHDHIHLRAWEFHNNHRYHPAPGFRYNNNPPKFKSRWRCSSKYFLQPLNLCMLGIQRLTVQVHNLTMLKLAC